MATLTVETAMDRAEAEFLKFQGLFYTEMGNHPELSYDEINERVVYTHPEFEDEDDQALYDNAAYVVALSQVLSVL
jgi:hypothetical protein